MLGQTISHYNILEKLGEGGMGVVYKATDTELDRPVALKFLSSQLTASEEERARFIREAKAVSSLDHPNICTVYEAGRAPDGQMFLAMAYYEGPSLKEKIEKGRIPIQEALRITIQVAEGLAAAHAKGIVHRDVKPGNIIVTPEDQVKLMDFGLAAQTGRTKLTRSHATIGTAAYMSPEQATGEGADHRSDLWSLGVVFYEMLTARLPFRGEHESALMYSIVNEEPQPILEILPDASAELQHIISRALEKEPAERYQTAADMLIDLRRLRKDTSRTGFPSVASKTKERKTKRNRLWIAMSSCVAVVVSFVLLSVYYPGGPRLNQKRTERVLTLPLADVRFPSLSADGKWMVVIAKDADEASKMFHVNVDDGSYRKISEEVAIAAAISPDGNQATFSSGSGDLRIIPTLGGIGRFLADSAGEAFWSRDGERIGFHARSMGRQPYVLEYRSIRPDGSDERTEFVDSSSAPYMYQFSASWSPDGTSIAYIHTYPEGYNEIHIQDLAMQTNVRLTHDSSVVYEVSWPHRDGMIFSSARRGVMQLWLVSPEGSEPEQITTGPGVHTVHASTDDARRVAYGLRTSQGELWRAHIERGTVERLNLSSGVRLYPAWSPDGTKIVVPEYTEDGSLRTSLVMIDLKSGQSRQLLPPVGYMVYPTWSPGGRWIAFGLVPFEGGSLLRDSVLTCVLDIERPGTYIVAGRGIPRQWLDDDRVVTETSRDNARQRLNRVITRIRERDQVPFMDGVNGFPFGRGLAILDVDPDLSDGQKLRGITTLDSLGMPGAITPLPYTFPKGVGFRGGVHPGWEWAVVTPREGERYLMNLRTGERRPVPPAATALLKDSPSYSTVIISPDEKEILIAKVRSTSQVVLIENLLE